MLCPVSFTPGTTYAISVSFENKNGSLDDLHKDGIHNFTIEK